MHHKDKHARALARALFPQQQAADAGCIHVQVVVEVHACSVNPTDWKQRKGTLSTICPLSLPCVLGIDLAGRVVRAGDESPFSEGDEVFGRQTLDRMRVLNGSYAEFCIVECSDISKKPPSLSFEQAAAVPHASLAAYAALARVGRLHEKRKQKDKAVLVLGGSGGVGTFAVQLAKHHFDCFTVASSSAANADFVLSLGADQVLDYNDPLFLISAGLTKYDVIVDCVGGDDYFKAFKGALSHDGVYVTLVGNTRYLADSKMVDWTNVLEVRADYLVRQISNKLGAAENYHILTGSQLKSGDLAIIASLIEKKTVRVIIDSSYSLYDIVKAHERSETRRAKGKIVVRIRGAKKDDPPTVASVHAPAQKRNTEQLPLHRGAVLPAKLARQAPQMNGHNLSNHGVRSLGAVSEDQDDEPSSEDEAVPMLMPRGRQGGGKGTQHSPNSEERQHGGVVIDEPWQMPSSMGSKKGVTYDLFRPPGVDSPQHTPPVSPPAAVSLESSTGSKQRSRNLSDMMPPSLSRDDDVLAPSSALLRVGVGPSELAQRSGTSRTAANKTPDGVWNATLADNAEKSVLPGVLERSEKSLVPAPIGSPRSLAAARQSSPHSNGSQQQFDSRGQGGKHLSPHTIPTPSAQSRHTSAAHDSPAPSLRSDSANHGGSNEDPSSYFFATPSRADRELSRKTLEESVAHAPPPPAPVLAAPAAPSDFGAMRSQAQAVVAAASSPQPQQHPGPPPSEDVEDLTGSHLYAHFLKVFDCSPRPYEAHIMRLHKHLHTCTHAHMTHHAASMQRTTHTCTFA